MHAREWQQRELKIKRKKEARLAFIQKDKEVCRKAKVVGLNPLLAARR